MEKKRIYLFLVGIISFCLGMFVCYLLQIQLNLPFGYCLSDYEYNLNTREKNPLKGILTIPTSYWESIDSDALLETGTQARAGLFSSDELPEKVENFLPNQFATRKVFNKTNESDFCRYLDRSTQFDSVINSADKDQKKILKFIYEKFHCGELPILSFSYSTTIENHQALVEKIYKVFYEHFSLYSGASVLFLLE